MTRGLLFAFTTNTFTVLSLVKLGSTWLTYQNLIGVAADYLFQLVCDSNCERWVLGNPWARTNQQRSISATLVDFSIQWQITVLMSNNVTRTRWCGNANRSSYVQIPPEYKTGRFHEAFVCYDGTNYSNYLRALFLGIIREHTEYAYIAHSTA